MFTCVIRYTLTDGNRAAFGDYARAWIALIEHYGGTHHGYFLPPEPGDPIPDAKFSFPGLGRDGPAGIAFALFSFPSVAAYEQYRVRVSEDPGCVAATARFNATPSFSGYERSFLIPIFK